MPYLIHYSRHTVLLVVLNLIIISLLMLLNFSRENADGTSVKQLGSNYWDVMVPSLVLSKEEKKIRHC